jgi:all-trans-retinol 13,14-reductase
MEKTNLTEQYDVIVIGSGIGGLTVAALLAKLAQKKVLVLEQHFTPGGCTHAFKRKGGYHWDVGLHYVGEMNPGSFGRAIFDYISEDRLDWQKIPDPFERFVYPDFTFDVSSDPNQYLRDLIQRYPSEERAIRQYFKDAKSTSSWVVLHNLMEVLPLIVRPLLRLLFQRFGSLALETTESYLNRNFKDETLKALLVSQWGDYGLAPSKSCFGIHSTIVTHYLNGAWYPVGGGAAIAQAIIPTIKKAGGKVLTQQTVTEILVESGTAKGVEVQRTGGSSKENRATYYAPVVVSGAGLYNTYSKLIPKHHRIQAPDSIQASNVGACIMTLYLGLKESPQTLGFNGGNVWLYTSYNHEFEDDLKAIYQALDPDLSNLLSSCYITFPSLKDPLAQKHTAEIIIGGDYDDLAEWEQKNWRKRGPGYEELKSKIAQAILQFVEKHYPGFQNIVGYQELATPLTYKHFIDNHKGEIYGLSYNSKRFGNQLTQARTPVKNLYLTGGDTFTSGILGAMFGGVKTASLIQGVLGFPGISLSILISNASRARQKKTPD